MATAVAQHLAHTIAQVHHQKISTRQSKLCSLRALVVVTVIATLEQIRAERHAVQWIVVVLFTLLMYGWIPGQFVGWTESLFYVFFNSFYGIGDILG